MLVVRCPQALILSQQVPETYKTVKERAKIQQLIKENKKQRDRQKPPVTILILLTLSQ